MNLFAVQRILGLLLILFSLTMLPPIGVSLYYADGNHLPFIDSFAALLAVGALIWWPARNHDRDLRLRDGFLVVALFWVVLGIAGAAPLVLSETPDISLTDAVFESVSGFTTTGATVLTGLDSLPKSFLYYRQQITWFGGIGLVVLAVALLPMLGIGGMQLLKAETPGSVKDNKLTPRITETAKALWLVYLIITAACAFSYWLAGMTPFDAIGHSFATVATAGYSTHDASFAYFDSAAIEAIAIVFMCIGGINFTLHFLAWRGLRLRNYWSDPECRAFLIVVFTSGVLCAATLMIRQIADPLTSLRQGMFQAVSVMTTTGFTTTDFSLWPGALPVILILTAFIGGSAGSTSGGMKVVRWLLMWKQGTREIVRLVHPSAILPVKLGNKPVEWRIIDAVWGFFAIYVVSFGVLMVAMMATGVDQVTAFSAIAATINNLGPGLGEVATTFSTVSDPGKWIAILAMLLGRLEIYPLLVLITPAFWRR
jgi:trk system potassium uptake protein TrkH